MATKRKSGKRGKPRGRKSRGPSKVKQMTEDFYNQIEQQKHYIEQQKQYCEKLLHSAADQNTRDREVYERARLDAQVSNAVAARDLAIGAHSQHARERLAYAMANVVSTLTHAIEAVK